MAGDRKTVLVTGAAGGIGRAACERLSSSGWNVVAVDRNAEKLAWVADAGHIAGFVADVTSQEDNLAMVAEAEARFGALHAIILNAGIGGSGRIDELSFEAFQTVISVNLFGAVLGIKAALPSLRRQQGGAVVVTSSAMGMGGEAENWAYCSSKHALIGLVSSLSRELGWEGIRINALCPGATHQTGLNEGMETRAPELYRQLASNVPLQRWADPGEMAAIMEFLISPASSYINGHALLADGGAGVGTGMLPPRAGDGRVMPTKA